MLFCAAATCDDARPAEAKAAVPLAETAASATTAARMGAACRSGCTVPESGPLLSRATKIPPCKRLCDSTLRGLRPAGRTYDPPQRSSLAALRAPACSLRPVATCSASADAELRAGFAPEPISPARLGIFVPRCRVSPQQPLCSLRLRALCATFEPFGQARCDVHEVPAEVVGWA